jgi:3-hydroxybutyryl-CoA dehydratase
MVGKTVTATCTVAAINAEKRRVRFDTRCEVEGKVVLEGEAEMLVPVRSSG